MIEVNPFVSISFSSSFDHLSAFAASLIQLDLLVRRSQKVSPLGIL